MGSLTDAEGRKVEFMQNDNPNTASPVRSAEVQKALDWLKLGTSTDKEAVSAIETYLTQLEASQPKPQQNGYWTEAPGEVSTFHPFENQPKPQQSEIEKAQNDRLLYGTGLLKDGKHIPLEASQPKIFMENGSSITFTGEGERLRGLEPAVTIGAVEVAREIVSLNNSAKPSNELVPLTAAIIQQAMDGATNNARVNEAYIKWLRDGFRAIAKMEDVAQMKLWARDTLSGPTNEALAPYLTAQPKGTPATEGAE